MNWFDVSKEGLKELQLRKPKHFVARELIQNAWDENIKVCKFESSFKNRKAFISVEDDSPIGFRNIEDAFTLFAPTYKRADPEKRGRFNVGEKQALSICDEASIQTTKGTIHFTKEGRIESKGKRSIGSKILVTLKMNESEYLEMLEVVKSYLVPKHIVFLVNGVKIKYRKPHKSTRVSLPTEIEENNVLKKTLRMSEISILKTKADKTYLYEMGIPVAETDCQFDIDVQQKIPLSMDRDTVSHSYVSILYAEVLNVTYEEIEDEDSSQIWIREAMGHKRIQKETLNVIIHKRFGEKVVRANPFDPNSVDDAISAGYKVITGSELSKEEWETLKESGMIQSSSEVFRRSTTESTPVDPDKNMLEVAELAKKIAKKCLNIDIKVSFANWDGVAAQYGDRILTFNVSVLGKSFFNPSLSADTIDIIIHEIAHEKGQHTEKLYLETITDIAGKLVMIALEDPKFFKK